MYKYSLPELKYSTDALAPHYKAEALEIHHQKHHAGYVKSLNQAMSNLAEAREKNNFGYLPKLEKDLAFNLSGHQLHSLLWDSLSPQGGGEPPQKLATRLGEHFGSVDAFREQFSAAALSIQGSGWVALSREPESGALIIQQIYDHQNNAGAGTQALLVLDMWEHAFYLQYRNEKAKWVKAFWEIVSWEHLAKAVSRDPAASLAA